MRLVDGGFLVNFIVECLLYVMKLSYCLVVEMKLMDTIQFLNLRHRAGKPLSKMLTIESILVSEMARAA